MEIYNESKKMDTRFCVGLFCWGDKSIAEFSNAQLALPSGFCMVCEDRLNNEAKKTVNNIRKKLKI